MAAIAKALGDPVRLQLVDVLRKHAGKVCVCELVPALRPLPADRLPSPQEAPRRRHRRLRARGPVGLLLRDPRRTKGVVRMAELTDTKTADARRLLLLRARGPGDCCEPSDKADCCPPESSCLRLLGRSGRRRGDPRGGPHPLRGRRAAASAPAARPASPAARRRRSSTDEEAKVFGAGPLRRGEPRASFPTPRRWPHSAAATRPRSPSWAPGRPSSTSAPAAASTCCSPPAGSARPARPTAST